MTTATLLSPTPEVAPDVAPPETPAADHLGDFTATRRMIPVALLAIVIGVLSGYVARALIDLIQAFTNLFFFQRLSTAPGLPAEHHLGYLVVLVPVVGALIIGVIARYGSERIRGHGIPEALEAILIKGSRVEARLAVLKPISSAISIGSGGPFGAEGPIIMTGGAFGSLVAQAFHLTNAERKTLLVAGAAGGMTATFGSPLAAILLALELLLFELKPRSSIPVALSCIAAMATRHFLFPEGALFHVPPHAAFAGVDALVGCLFCGLCGGGVAILLSRSVYACEDLFQVHLRRIHWMWWPAIAGVGIGVGGLIAPRALGVGYESIADLLAGNLTLSATLSLLVVKWFIWAFSLGSGTSGGVLAPLLMLGAGVGTLEASVLPSVGPGFWPLISMAAVFGGTMRSPITAVLFALEVTHDWDAVVPLAAAVIVSHGVTVLGLKRSILTEKVARRGYHVTREYTIDPLEVLFVRDVVRTDVTVFPCDTPLAVAAASFIDRNRQTRDARHAQRLYPVLDAEGRLRGAVTRRDMLDAALSRDEIAVPATVDEIAICDLVV
ncbi:MAG TPA: chloride channel protein, partial [Polyangiaceae bacterium]|nr:chloride channel protein [Polyangiaceae bacterium]